MRSRIDKEYDPNENRGVNPHRRCVCANWNNEDGSCSYCEWEEEHAEEETQEQIPNEDFIRELIGDEAFDIIRNSEKTVKEMLDE